MPEIFSSVKTDQCSAEGSDPFYTADTPNAQASEDEPEIPLGGEAFMSKSVESCPAKGSGEGEA